MVDWATAPGLTILSTIQQRWRVAPHIVPMALVVISTVTARGPTRVYLFHYPPPGQPIKNRLHELRRAAGAKHYSGNPKVCFVSVVGYWVSCRPALGKVS